MNCHPIYSGRWVKLALLAWLCLWFGVIVPGHQVGAIRVAGPIPDAKPTPGPQSPMAIMPLAGCCQRTGESSRGTPMWPRRNSCAVCQLVAKLDVPAAIIITTPPLLFSHLLHVHPVESVHAVASIYCLRSRDPPASIL